MHPTFTALAKKQAKNDLIGSVQRALRILELLAFYPTGLNAKPLIDQVKHMAADATRTLRILGYIGPASAGEQDR